jgi:hypothetical protein
VVVLQELQAAQVTQKVQAAAAAAVLHLPAVL